jgi:hypothetical protein
VGTLKSVFGVIRALAPVLYCGGLLYYFFGVGGSVENAKEIGLYPTLMGLGIVGLLFCIPLTLKIVRLISGPRSPGSGGHPGGPARDDNDGFDADAAIARYMAERSAEIVPNPPPLSSKHGGGGPARRPGFGRKVR